MVFMILVIVFCEDSTPYTKIKDEIIMRIRSIVFMVTEVKIKISKCFHNSGNSFCEDSTAYY